MTVYPKLPFSVINQSMALMLPTGPTSVKLVALIRLILITPAYR